jgi:hypothetical protein
VTTEATCTKCGAVIAMGDALYTRDAAIVCARCAANEGAAPDFTGIGPVPMAAYASPALALLSWLLDPTEIAAASAVVLSVYALVSMGKPALRAHRWRLLTCAAFGLLFGSLRLAFALGGR